MFIGCSLVRLTQVTYENIDMWHRRRLLDNKCLYDQILSGLFLSGKYHLVIASFIQQINISNSVTSLMCPNPNVQHWYTKPYKQLATFHLLFSYMYFLSTVTVEYNPQQFIILRLWIEQTVCSSGPADMTKPKRVVSNSTLCRLQLDIWVATTACFDEVCGSQSIHMSNQ